MGTQTATSEEITTSFWAKPIPDRRYDWTATFKGYDEGDPVGYGHTEAEAIADLHREVEFRAS